MSKRALRLPLSANLAANLQKNLFQSSAAAQSQSHSNEEDNSSSLSSLSSLSSPSPRPDNNGVNSLNALISVIKQHSNRKDVVRACVRSLVNLSKFRSLLAWVDATENIGPVLAAAAEVSE